MKNLLLAALLLVFASAPALASEGVAVGTPAPAFTATDSDGKTVSLADQKGKIVVLEWTNDGCPFVGKQYSTGNMQALQKKAKADGIVWFSVISSGPGEQGNVDGARANELTKSRDAAPSAVLLDTKGVIGHLYGAKTTPHMFVINKDGLLAYAGAMDSDSSLDKSGIAKATNYVAAALEDLKAGRKVKTESVPSYGCSVKYAG